MLRQQAGTTSVACALDTNGRLAGGPLAVSAVPVLKFTGMLLPWRSPATACTSSTVVVTTRSAAANIKAKIRKCERTFPTSRWVCRSYLHGLALDDRHPDLSGLQLDSATLITPNQSHRLYLRRAVDCHHPRSYSQLLEGRQFDGKKQRLRRQSVLRTEVLPWLLV